MRRREGRAGLHEAVPVDAARASGTIPDGRKYHAAYFERYPGVWRHGDYVELTEHDGVIIYGRSDAVLNPGGVRIGTAEIYRQVEQIDEVVESLVVGQRLGPRRADRAVRAAARRPHADGRRFARRIKRRIRETTTPRHVPARIVQVPEIPRTKSGKIVELAVRDVVHGREVKNREALANPEALEFFRIGGVAIEASDGPETRRVRIQDRKLRRRPEVTLAGAFVHRRSGC